MKVSVMIPEHVEVKLEERKVIVQGPKGKLSRDFSSPAFNAYIELSCNDVFAVSSTDERKAKAMAGTIASHVKNMISGVSSGFICRMKVFYTHFPITVTVSGKADGRSKQIDEQSSSGTIEIRNFFGEKGARKAKIVGNTSVRVEKDEIVLTGIDKEDIGQTAANIEAACRLSKRDRRVFQDGIYIIEKPKQLDAPTNRRSEGTSVSVRQTD